MGNVLSGGDGLAFKQFTPLKTGIYHITAKAGRDEGKGVLLSLSRKAGVVIVDVEGSLLETPFSKKPRSGSTRAISEINERFPVIFLSSGFLSVSMTKAWLKDNAFGELPVISWEQGDAFDMISRKGFQLKAVIGSAQVIESANTYHPLTFSFEEAEGTIRVKDWQEISRKLK
jgi:hypothetical protein